MDFHEIVRHPRKFHRRMHRALEQKDRAQGERLDPVRLQMELDRLLNRDESHDALTRIRAQGRQRAGGLILAALKDPRFVRGRSEEILDRGSFADLCSLVQEWNIQEATPILAKYIRHPDEQVRKEVSISLGGMGSEESIPALRILLRDKADYVREYAMRGLGQALKTGRLQPVTLDATFPLVLRLVNRKTSTAMGTAPSLLLRLDRTRACALLLTSRYLSPKNPELHNLVRALNEAGVEIPVRISVRLWNCVRHRRGYPAACIQGELLVAMARARLVGIEEMLDRAIRTADQHVAEQAARARCLLRGISNAHDAAFAAWERAGHRIHRLREPLQTYLAVRFFIDEVTNGGLSQYFFNSSGDHTALSLKGLKAIGAERTASRFESAMLRFGPEGPSGKRMERERQLSRVVRRYGDDVFEELEQKLYAGDEPLEVLLQLFAARHPGVFGSAPPK